MLDWKRCWPEAVTEGMSFVEIGGKLVYTFEDMPQSLYHSLCGTARQYPDKTALVSIDGEHVTYSRFVKMVDGYAGCLSRRYGIQKGSHVGIMLYNGIEFCAFFLALSKLGAVTVLLPSKYQKEEILSLAGKADLHHLICEETFYDWFSEEKELGLIKNGPEFQAAADAWEDQAAAEACGRWEDPAILMFTSGTTAKSKGVLLKNYNILHSVEVYRRVLNLTEEDVSLVATPMYHITGTICILAVFLTIGGTLYIQKKVDPDVMLQCFVEHKVTFFHASPTVFALLLNRRSEYPSIPSMKSFACGSANMAPANIHRLHEWMPDSKFHTVYGLTETSGAGTIFPDDASVSPLIGSSGVPMPNLEVMVVDEDGKELPDGIIGEILLRGSFLLEDYYKSGNRMISEDGWLKTGDLGYCSPEGYLYISDRKKDMINRGGEKICSFDVENELMKLPGILEAAVVGIPDEKYIEVPVAAVCFEAGVHWETEEIRDELKKRMARYKVPCDIMVLEKMPKTPNGKMDKRAVRKLFCP